jgi:hypothetical protein
VELPGVVDRILQNTVRTPGWDSHADEAARLKTGFFMAHYHVRAIGYGAFHLLVGLIVAGLSTSRTGLAALGAVGVMLPVGTSAGSCGRTARICSCSRSTTGRPGAGRPTRSPGAGSR